MEFIVQALTYPNIKKIIYTSAAAMPTKAISDLRAYIAQKVDVIVIFADAEHGAAADRQGSDRSRHPRRPAQRHLCRRRGRQGLS